MNYPILMRSAVLAAALGACGVFAQTRPSATDTGPAPAQERDSIGAVVLDNSMVLAQRRNAFERASMRTGVASVGRGVLGATLRAQRKAELAQAREEEAAELYRRGAGGLVEK